MARNRLIRCVLATIAAGALLIAVCLPKQLEIIGPRLGIPAILVPGDQMQISLRASWPLLQPDWQLSLESADARYPLTLVESDGWTPQRRLTVQLPADIPPAAYALHVAAGSAHKIAEKAVHVLDHYPAEFKIIHIADLPVFGEPGGKGEAQMTKLVEEINIIHPDLVVASGDIAYGASHANYQTLYDFFLQINAPLVVGPGNHEFEAWNGYLEYFRQRYHTVKFGFWQIITLDSSHRRDQLTWSQLRWLNEVLDAHGDAPSLVNIHHPLFEDRGLQFNVDRIMQALSEHGVHLVLAGHNHGDRLFDNQGQRRLDTWDLPGPLNIVTTSAGAKIYPKQSDSPLHHGYRLVRINGDRVTDFTYDYDGDGKRDASASIPVDHLNLTQTGAGRAQLENRLHESFHRVRMQIHAASPDLKPNRGKLISVQPVEEGFLYTVELPVLQAGQTITVRLIRHTQPGLPS